MDHSFSDKILTRVVCVFRARHVSHFSLLCRKSIQYLDLNPAEYQSIKVEGIRKRLVADRKILYKYHLDLTFGLERLFFKQGTYTASRKPFHIGTFFVSARAYNYDLEKYIVEAIRSHQTNKIEKLRNYMKIITLLNFDRRFDTANFLYENLLEVLYTEECNDSRLVIYVVTLLDFDSWFFKINIYVLAYVLKHAYESKCIKYLWRLLPPGKNPVFESFQQSRPEAVRLLVMYGIPMICPDEFHFDDIPVEPSFFFNAVSRGLLSYRRAILLYQVLFDFEYNPDEPVVLRRFWKSIKDPFLSESELYNFLQPVMSVDGIEEVNDFYSESISETVCINPIPRTLKHLCRVAIRERLGDLQELPSGINLLPLPSKIKSYLFAK